MSPQREFFTFFWGGATVFSFFLRYSLFTDTGTDESNAKMQTYIWSLVCTKNIAGYDFPSKGLTPYGDNDVKGEFNGDFGFNAFKIRIRRKL